jgi:hypothetical protein
MSNVEIIRNYFKKFFSGKARHSAVRNLLTDDFTFHDPLMTASSAEDYVQQLVGLGDELEMYAEVRAIVGEGDDVAALVDFSGPFGKITYAQWFQMCAGKIAKLDVIYDPRPFLNMGKKD